ncbi:SEL1-like repeat protein [Oxalobacter vibrioformis]|uniref:SEL1-like repeat protein n=1 Tax=Oxalobacter vibrioformis TaxID=933080 RepID=A0A9E9LU73_9BURK|nr:SEL1-like repeat protein [Oxalobacter vibrioformis]NLC24815.1 SEL1-like repeat protein [Oxalobacter sp.]WAW09710.1 SEL1-like repeat protein [Oxalobacter vibrioformis]
MPQNGLLNEYANPELSRFYPEPPAVSPETARRIRTDAEAGDTDAQVQLGMLYLTGRAVQKNPDTACTGLKKRRKPGMKMP